MKRCTEVLQRQEEAPIVIVPKRPFAPSCHDSSPEHVADKESLLFLRAKTRGGDDTSSCQKSKGGRDPDSICEGIQLLAENTKGGIDSKGGGRFAKFLSSPSGMSLSLFAVIRYKGHHHYSDFGKPQKKRIEQASGN